MEEATKNRGFYIKIGYFPSNRANTEWTNNPLLCISRWLFVCNVRSRREIFIKNTLRFHLGRFPSNCTTLETFYYEYICGFKNHYFWILFKPLDIFSSAKKNKRRNFDYLNSYSYNLSFKQLQNCKDGPKQCLFPRVDCKSRISCWSANNKCIVCIIYIVMHCTFENNLIQKKFN